MARIRTIKPEFFRNAKLYRAEVESGLPLRLAFAGLWTAADREGRFVWRPDELKLDALPYDPIDFAKILDALAERGYIIRYEIDGQTYGAIPSWNKHQIVNHREAVSRIPDIPVQKENANACPTRHDNARACPGMPGHAQEFPTAELELEGEKELIKMAPDPLRVPDAADASDLTSSFPDEPFADQPVDPKAVPVDPLYKPIMDSCLAVTPTFANYAKEGASAKRLCKMIRDRKPENPEEFTREILELFLALRKTGTPFWRGQPFTPSAISSAGIFDRLMVEYEKRRERADTSWIPEELGAPV